MNDLPTAIVNAGMILGAFGGIVLCVRYDQRGRSRRRELEHAERMRALELDRPLEDAATARYKALGAVGVAVPIASLSAAVIGSCFAFVFKDPPMQFATFAVTWASAAAVCVAVLPAVVARLRESPPGADEPDDAD